MTNVLEDPIYEKEKRQCQNILLVNVNKVVENSWEEQHFLAYS
jgi:hypothetical protein